MKQKITELEDVPNEKLFEHIFKNLYDTVLDDKLTVEEMMSEFVTRYINMPKSKQNPKILRLLKLSYPDVFI